MLRITVPAQEMWDEVNEQFVYGDEVTLELEHSLVSLSKWESKHHKAFLSKREKTAEENLDYIKCMTLTKDVPDDVYARLTQENIDQIVAYIEDPMSDTYYFDDKKQSPSRDAMTAAASLRKTKLERICLLRSHRRWLTTRSSVS